MFNSGPVRPRYKIDEETSLYFRTLAFKWKDIASLLLVSRGTIWRPVRDLGIAEKPGFRNIAGTHRDDVFGSFMEIQGGLGAYLMVRGWVLLFNENISERASHELEIDNGNFKGELIQSLAPTT